MKKIIKSDYSIAIEKNGVFQCDNSKGEKFSAFAINDEKVDNKYIVTHLKTGYVVFKFKYKKTAREFIKAMEYQLENWSDYDVEKMNNNQDKIMSIRDKFCK